jgi:hypothetical protein
MPTFLHTGNRPATGARLDKLIGLILGDWALVENGKRVRREP